MEYIDYLEDYQCLDCGRIFYIDSGEDGEVYCPICVVPRVSGEGDNVVKLSEGKGDYNE